MRKKFTFLLTVFLLLLVFALYAETPTFYPAERVQYQGHDLRNKYDGTNYNYYSVPVVVDWNGDDKKDLLVGYFYYGNVFEYLNSGTHEEPIFETETKLQSDGSNISVAYG